MRVERLANDVLTYWKPKDFFNGTHAFSYSETSEGDWVFRAGNQSGSHDEGILSADNTRRSYDLRCLLQHLYDRCNIVRWIFRNLLRCFQSMPTCPHCGLEVRVRELRHQGLFKSFRTCPDCGGSFTVDTDTKYRQAACIFIAVISLAFTILLYFRDTEWLIPALVSYAILGLLIYWGNRKLFFVPDDKGQSSTKDT